LEGEKVQYTAVLGDATEQSCMAFTKEWLQQQHLAIHQKLCDIHTKALHHKNYKK
jgi:hypothetical protein